MNAFAENRWIRLFFKANGVVSVLVLAGIFGFLFLASLDAFSQISLSEFFSWNWNPSSYSNPQWGFLGLLYSSFLVVLVSLGIAVPAGVLTALYLSEIASPGVREFLKPVVELIASIPSVVLGLVGLLVLSPFVASVFGLANGLNVLTAGLIVAVMVLPTVASLCEDVFSTVPGEYRSAGLALGATKWQLIKSVVVPSSLSGVFAAVMLGLGRAVGETIAVLMIAGNALKVPESLFDAARPLTANIAIEIKEAVVGSTHYSALFATGFVLFLITLLVNLAAEWVLQRQKRFESL
ncbi:MAG: phosphate ABC transporter permease subunit PstC [Candidatus Micrarchaeia archaeon]